MACFQVARPGLSPALGLRTGLQPRRLSGRGGLLLRCRLQKSNSDSNGEEPPESLFMKELRRRGITPTSLLEESNRGSSYELGEKEMEMKEGSGSGRSRGQMNRNGVASMEFEKGIADQRKRSLALNSEGLEGLVPRAKLLLTIGGTFFLGFWPLILITIAFFASLYFNKLWCMRAGKRDLQRLNRIAGQVKKDATLSSQVFRMQDMLLSRAVLYISHIELMSEQSIQRQPVHAYKFENTLEKLKLFGYGVATSTF